MKINYEEYWKDRIEKNYIPLMPRHREIVRIITGTKNSGRVLDLGCGEGHILKMLPDSYEKYGVDISESALNLIIERDISVKLCNLNKDFPFDIKFDFIICSEVLEHLERPSNVLKNVKKHLTKDGLFLVTTPNVTLWKHRIRLLFGEFPNYDKSHINFWDIEDFIDMLINHGYVLLDFYPTGFSPIPNLSLKLKLRKLKFLYKLLGEQFLFICRIK